MAMMRLRGKTPRVTLVRRLFAFLLPAVLAGSLLLSSASALAGPRSGGSFGGRMFRNGGGFSAPRSSYGTGYGYGGGSHFFFLPSFGWGWGGFGGGGGLSSLVVLGVLGIAAFSLVRAARRYRGAGGGWGSGNVDSYDDEVGVVPGRAYVYRFQAALGRSARGM